MKWWKIEIDHANNNKTWDLLERFGMGGYGFYIWTLNSLHSKEDDGYQIEATDTWVRKTAHECFIGDKHTVIRYLDAFAEIGLIDGRLWAEKIVYSDEVKTQAQKLKQDFSYRRHQSSIFNRDGFKCVYCGSSRKLTLDHKIPQSRGGSHDPNNLVTCCSSCNSKKGAKTPQEWLGEIA